MAPPVVVSSKVQQSTPSGSEAVPGAIYVGSGSLYRNVRICMARSPESAVEAMADTGQFTVSAGYAKINTVEVPQRRGIAIFAGFDPVTATLPIILDRLGQPTNFAVEEACAMLELMAGQGYGPGGRYKGAAQQGRAPKPLILEAVEGPHGHPTKLVPANYNAAEKDPSVEWYITGLEWGDSIRSGQSPYQRVRQKVAVTFTEYDRETAAARKVVWQKFKVGGKTGQSPYELVKDRAHWPASEAHKWAEELRKRWNAGHSRKRIATINTKFHTGQEVEVPIEG